MALRHFDIFAFRVVGIGYYEDPEKPLKFRNGQRVAVLYSRCTGGASDPKSRTSHLITVGTDPGSP